MLLKNELRYSDSPQAYRRFVVEYMKKHDFNIDGMDIGEFGVYAGNSLREVYTLLKSNHLIPRKFFGFDCFTGLPESEGLYWQKGILDARSFFKTHSIENIKKNILSTMPDKEICVELIDGLFEDSLNDALLKNINVFCWVNIDSDLYTSALQALDYIFKNHLVAANSIISYDDWGGTEEFVGGESRAHKEISEKYNVDFELLSFCGISPHLSTVFIIKKIGTIK